jgi:hypothetical protein
VASQATVLDSRIRGRSLVAPNIFDLEICEHNHTSGLGQVNTNYTWNEFNPKYDNDSKNVLEVEVSMVGAITPATELAKYTNVVMNEDLIEIQLKKSTGPKFNNILGRYHESKFKIDPEGTTTTYPLNLRDGIFGNTGETQAGCAPFAYRENGDNGFVIGTGHPSHPHDFYLFPEFYLRIHKNHITPHSSATVNAMNLANLPKAARYQDGQYVLKTRVTNIHGTATELTNPVNFEIDNFLPYVEKVRVDFDNAGNVEYTGKYSDGTNNQITFSETTVFEGTYASSGKVTVLSTVSETILSLSCKLVEPDGTEHIAQSGSAIDAEGLEWQLTFNNVKFSGGEYRIDFFDAVDVSGNSLLNFDTWGGAGLVETIPHRTLEKTATNDGTWIPADPLNSSGRSRIYRINFQEECVSPGGFKSNSGGISESVDCECEPYADFVTMPQIGGFSIDFDATHLCGGTETLNYMWDYGDGSSSSNSPSNIINTHDYADPGTYTIQLRVTDPCGNTATATHQVVVEGNNSLTVTIEGATTAQKDQLVPFDAVVAGGTPPYTYQWLVDGGSPAYVPPPSPQQGLHKSHQDIKFGQYTPSFAPAIVRCIVTDAYGASQLASHPIVVEESNIEIDFNHLPDLPSGVNCSNSLIKGAYLHWAAFITPLFSLEPPLEFIWDFGDGTIINTTEPQGQCEHSFESDGSFIVKFKVCNPLTGACYEHSKTYCVGTPTQPTSSYSFTPNGTPVINSWNSAPISIKFIGSVCAPVVSGKPRLTWQTIYFPDCNYRSGWEQGSCVSDLYDELKIPSPADIPSNFVAEILKPSNFTPWGCLSVRADDLNPCNNGQSCLPAGQPIGAQNPCIVYIKPPRISVTNITKTEISNCTYALSATVEGGARKIINPGVGGQYILDELQYEWAAYDYENSEQELVGFFVDKTVKGPMINQDHPYITSYPAGKSVMFIAKLKVIDRTGQVGSGSQVIAINPFRLSIKASYSRCPETLSYFESEPLVTGGNGNLNYTWSVIAPVGGGLMFESGDSHDENPYFKAPQSGSITYRLVVQMLNNNGQIICERSKNIIVTAKALVLNIPATVKACATGGTRIIGPSEPLDLGGSGNYGFEWSTANTSDLSKLSDIFAARPTVQNMPVNQTVVYTLTVGDIMSQCLSTATVSVTGYANNVTVGLGNSLAPCYGEPIVISGSASPINPPTFPLTLTTYPLDFSWKSNHPRMDLFVPGPGPTGTLPEEMVRTDNGNYIFTIMATHNETGCSASSDLTVKVPLQWQHKGYVPTIETIIAGTSAPLWKDGSVNNILGGPGIPQPNIGINWSPLPVTGITYNTGTLGSLIPSNGRFIPTAQQPFTTMSVTDNWSGCVETYKSIRYIVTSAAPTIHVKSNNYISCEGDEVCVDIVFDCHLSGNSSDLLPPKVTLSWMFNKDGPSFIHQGNIDAYLMESSGVYKARLCLTQFVVGDPSGYSLDIFVFDSSNKIKWNAAPLMDYRLVRSSAPAFNSPINYIGCDGPTTYNLQRQSTITIASGCGNNIPMNKKFDGSGEVFAKDFIHLVSDYNVSYEPAEGRMMHFFIDPCLTQGLIEPPIERNIITTLQENPLAFDLSIVPNPFHSEITVRFHFDELLPQSVDLELYDVTGRKISVLHKWIGLERGDYSEKINVDYLPPGLYTYVLRLSNGKQISKQSIKI